MPVTNYIWDEVNDTLLEERDEAGNLIAEYTHEPTRYGPLLSQRRNGHTYYHHYDGLGNTRALTDESGHVTDRYTYTAFGELVANSGTTTNPFGYKGALGYYANPETNDLYVRARTYDPLVARWLSQDPSRYDAGDLTLFRYGFDNSLIHADPSGEQATDSCQICGPDIGISLTLMENRVRSIMLLMDKKKKKQVCLSMFSSGGWDIPMLAGKTGLAVQGCPSGDNCKRTVTREQAVDCI